MSTSHSVGRAEIPVWSTCEAMKCFKFQILDFKAFNKQKSVIVWTITQNLVHFTAC